MTNTADLAKAEIKDSYSRLLNHLPGAVYRSEILGDGASFSENYEVRLRFLSDGIAKILEVLPDELPYNINAIEAITIPKDLEAARKAIYQSFVDKEPYQVIYRIQPPNGSMKWLWDLGEVVSSPGEPLFMEGIILDISAHKQHEIALRQKNKQLQDSLNSVLGYGDIVGRSETMRKMYMQIEKAGNSQSNVLILGETGSGKELVARAIHNLSNKKGRFVAVNCGAIPEQLLESEFFGYAKGAFSGAEQNREGFIGAANGGTLFLDEIGELPLHLQVKLLRALETKTYTPVGSNDPINSSFHLIAATHQDLPKMVKDKKMRSDFYYRINVLPINVPPLRDRAGDIPLLLNAYMERTNIVEDVPLHVRVAMESYSWPGNVRELNNFMERYFLFGSAVLAELQEEGHLDFMPLQEIGIPLEKAVENFEYKIILQTMEKCRWRQKAASDMLCLNLRTFQRKLKHYNINSREL